MCPSGIVGFPGVSWFNQMDPYHSDKISIVLTALLLVPYFIWVSILLVPQQQLKELIKGLIHAFTYILKHLPWLEEVV